MCENVKELYLECKACRYISDDELFASLIQLGIKTSDYHMLTDCKWSADKKDDYGLVLILQYAIKK